MDSISLKTVVGINQKEEQNELWLSYSRIIPTHQMECFAVWFNFMFFHVFYKAAVCVSVTKKEQIFRKRMYRSFTS